MGAENGSRERQQRIATEHRTQQRRVDSRCSTGSECFFFLLLLLSSSSSFFFLLLLSSASAVKLFRVFAFYICFLAFSCFFLSDASLPLQQQKLSLTTSRQIYIIIKIVLCV